METKMNFNVLIKRTGSLLVVIILLAAWFQACQYSSESYSDFSSGEGSGGSMARFTVAGNYLYTVDQYSLKVFSLSNPRTPEFKVGRQVGFDIETIFPLDKNLFMGTSTGMYIYDITNPENPQKVSFYEHIYSCDPVVSDGDFAYVTLSSSNQRCWRASNELQIVDIQNLAAPKLIKQYTLVKPRGLAVRNDTLWVCDEGIKVFDVKNKQQINLLYHFKDLAAYDIILNGRLALVTGESGFTQYRLENDTIRKISEIKVNH